MKCVNCGNEVEDTAVFCKYCGAKIKQADNAGLEEASVLNPEKADVSSDTESSVYEETASAAAVNANVSVKKERTISGKVKALIIGVLLLAILCIGAFCVYNLYISKIVSVSVNDRDYKIVSDEKLAFNYVGDLTKGELYIIKNGEGTKIADNVLVDTYYINPNRDVVFYSALTADNSNKNYLYKNGEAEVFDGSFYKFTEDGKYMLYTDDSKVYMYDCDTGKQKKIASTDNDPSAWKYGYDDKNGIVYLCLSESNRLYRSGMSEEEEAESIATDIESFNVFGSNAYGYKKNGNSDYEIKTQNTEEPVTVDFSDINNIQASQDGTTVLFSGSKDEGTNKEYSLYAMIEGVDEPIRLLGGPIYSFVYKEEINKVYALKDETLYSIDLAPRTRKNMSDADEYYAELSECEAVKIESNLSAFKVSPNGENIVAVKTSAADETEDKAADEDEKTIVSHENKGTPSGSFLSVVYAADEAQDNNNENQEERVVGNVVEMVIIKGEEKKSVDVVDSPALCEQYLSVSNDTVLYPLAVNGKVELHIIENIADDLSSAEKDDDVLCSNTGLFKCDNVFDEFVYFDKDNNCIVNYSGGKKLNADKAVDYDLIYIDAGKGFDNYNLAYKKVLDYNEFIGKYRMKGNDESLDDIIIEFTESKEIKVYSIGSEQASCKFNIDDSKSNRTSFSMSPEGSTQFAPLCKPYYNHNDYTYSLVERTIMTDNSLLISDFDGLIKYRISTNENVTLEKLSEDEFNTEIASQQTKHNSNVNTLQSEKKAAEEAAAEEARREALQERAVQYYYNDVYVTSYETLYSWHSRSNATSYTYNNNHKAYVYDYYVDYDNGDIWLETRSAEGRTHWVVR